MTLFRGYRSAVRRIRRSLGRCRRRLELAASDEADILAEDCAAEADASSDATASGER